MGPGSLVEMLGTGSGQLVRAQGPGPGRPENRLPDLAVWREVLVESREQDLTGRVGEGPGVPWAPPHVWGLRTKP